MTALAVQFVVTVLALTVRDMCVSKQVSPPTSFVTLPKAALSATECQGKDRLGNLCNEGTGVCTLVDGNEKRLGLMECITPDCGDPGNPENGAVDVSGGTTFPNVITYTCDTGYTLNGAAERTCQSDGTWSGEEPTCVLTTPPMPSCFNARFNQDYVLTEGGPYYNNLNILGCFLAPVGTSITVTFKKIELECERGTAVCDDIHDCKYDWFQVIDNGTYLERVCGTVSNYVISGLSNDVKLWFFTDDGVQFFGENTNFIASYE